MAQVIFDKAGLITPNGMEILRSYRYGEKEFRVTASKYGVSFNESPVFHENADLQRFARAMGDAWKDYLSLRRTGKPYEVPPGQDDTGESGTTGLSGGVDQASELPSGEGDQAAGSGVADRDAGNA